MTTKIDLIFLRFKLEHVWLIRSFEPIIQFLRVYYKEIIKNVHKNHAKLCIIIYVNKTWKIIYFFNYKKAYWNIIDYCVIITNYILKNILRCGKISPYITRQSKTEKALYAVLQSKYMDICIKEQMKVLTVIIFG